MQMRNRSFAVVLLITLWNNVSFSMDLASSCPSIRTPYFPVSAEHQDLCKIYRFEQLDQEETFFEIGTGISEFSTYPIYKTSTPFAKTPLIKANFEYSSADYSYVVKPFQTLSDQLPLVKLSLQQVKKLSTLMDHYSLILWNGQSAYKLVQKEEVTLSLTEQCLQANNDMIQQRLLVIAEKQECARLKQELRDLQLKQVTQDTDSLEKNYKKALERSYIYNNPNARIASETSMNLEEWEEKKTTADPHYFPNMAKDLVEKISGEQQIEPRKPTIYKIFKRLCIVGIGAGSLWFLFLRNRG